MTEKPPMDPAVFGVLSVDWVALAKEARAAADALERAFASSARPDLPPDMAAEFAAFEDALEERRRWDREQEAQASKPPQAPRRRASQSRAPRREPARPLRYTRAPKKDNDFEMGM
ncbi:hypothetical protein [Corynebacterium heidelbergense]|uniref:Uncharacterized protein n=1 Tax=Corynebacterium heidelbergense TaxID=2055947 RepID=A0A364VDX6_9CORY|nr:hypothetical protein [Corynebacterium heidelbergense]RAV34766.1 hypothetical protein CWC39_01600 [Corynebacterium heidelbergense]WCZ37031.1 hypothetical protein CHEID_07490 [Corynebacterium heidelbergense]